MRAFLFLMIISLIACTDTKKVEFSSEVQQVTPTGENQVVQHPEWSKNASLYEINVRHHSPRGSVGAVIYDLDRINDLGADILCFMPIQPTGIKNRKASDLLDVSDVPNFQDRKKYLGSPFAISDYKSIHPDLGSMDDFEVLIKRAHKNGQKVILDWVAAFTSVDHKWIKNGNEEWYLKDSLGNFVPPYPNRNDLAKLDFSIDSMRLTMIETMKFWVKEIKIDGFRCYKADEVPLSFWEESVSVLKKVNPNIFMLAHAEKPNYHQKVFNMTYGARAYEVFNHVARREWPLDSIVDYLSWEENHFSTNDYRMMYTSNFEENAEVGTVFDRMGNNYKALTVLAFTFYGMPMIYGGQEFGNDKQLPVFMKDTVQKADVELEGFYKALLNAKKKNEALWNGTFGGRFERIYTVNNDDLFCFKRIKNDNTIVTVINLSNEKQQVNFKRELEGYYKSIFNEETLSVYTSGTNEIEPNGYQIFVKQ